MGFFFSLSLNSAPPVPSEDIDKHRRRFNMRMLVPGRPVKDTTPPPVPAERPSYKEKFIPPELSMWDYFVAKVRGLRNACFICVCLHHIGMMGQPLGSITIVHTFHLSTPEAE